MNFAETKEVITLHGLGFLQVKLQGGARLHVWHPDLPRRSCFKDSNIHNHRFGFKSTVLVGTLVNVMQHVTPFTSGGWSYEVVTHVAYLHEGERTQFGNRPWVSNMEVEVVPGIRKVVPAGSYYHMAQYDFHSTEIEGDGRCATLMIKAGEGSQGAHSLCAVGVQPDVDFDRKQWSESRLWEVVVDVLGGRGMTVLP